MGYHLSDEENKIAFKLDSTLLIGTFDTKVITSNNKNKKPKPQKLLMPQNATIIKPIKTKSFKQGFNL